MNLLFAINKSFIGLFLNCMKSIVKNGGAEGYDVYILQSDFDDEAIQTIENGVGENVKCNFIYVDENMFKDFPESKRYPKQIYYRLVAPFLLPKELDRVLYLDVDLVVINPLEELYEMDFEGNYYIASTHIKRLLSKVNQIRLGVDLDREMAYVNTGVMVYNLPILREKIKVSDIKDYVEKMGQLFILPDQDILAGLYGDKIKLVDMLIYNLSDRMLAFYNADIRNEKIDVEWVRKNSVIIHYCGKNKPWKKDYSGVLDVFYNEVAAK